MPVDSRCPSIPDPGWFPCKPEARARDSGRRLGAEADIVVTTDPPQIPMAAEDQQAIVEPARQLGEGVGIGAAFERLEGEYTLDGGAKAFLYRRTGPVTAEEAGELSAALQRSYPDRPYIFEYQSRPPQ
jgi:hypothetical protein